MLQVTEDEWDALGVKAGAVRSTTVGYAQYQGATTPLHIAEQGSLTWSADAAIQCRGSVRVVGFGNSLVPRSRTDALAPYGQEISLAREVHLRGGVLSIPLGIYRITANDGGRETQAIHSRRLPGVDPFPLDDLHSEDFPPASLGALLREKAGVLDWEVGVELADRLRMLERGKIVDPASPAVGASMYSELQRIGLFALQQSPAVPDVNAPRSLVYEDRLSGVHSLCALGGAKPRVTRQGALIPRPADRWATEPSSAAEFDIEGIITWQDKQTDDFQNFVWAHSPDGKHSAFAALEDDADPRSVNRSGPSTYEHSSPAYTSKAAAQAGAQTILKRLLNRRSRTVTVEVGLQGLLVELSDVGWVRDPLSGRAAFGEVAGVTVSHTPSAPVTLRLIVAEEA